MSTTITSPTANFFSSPTLRFSQFQNTPPSSPSASSYDRFIPRRKLSFSRDLSNFDDVSREQEKAGPVETEISAAKEDYRRTLRECILSREASKAILQVTTPTSPRVKPDETDSARSPTSPSSNTGSDIVKAKRTPRFIPKSPDKILDAPELVDDYYLNLLDWSSTNTVAVALGQSVFLWNASTGATHKLVETSGSGNIITSLAWANNGNCLAIGTHSAEIQLWDVEANMEVRRMREHSSRVASLSWGSPSLLSSGSRDATIVNHDVRAQPRSLASVFLGHQQEVCGLKWSLQGTQLASGGNDNMLYIWEPRQTRARLSIEKHSAAVKALAWCPFLHNVLASGGGTADRRICLWNTGNGLCLNEVDTKSQVCSIQWSVHDKEFVSSHGFTHNQLIVWRYLGAGRVQKVTELTGHQARVLHMARSPDGTTVVSAAADETLRFWRIFGSPTRSAAKLKDEQARRSLMGANLIR